MTFPASWCWLFIGRVDPGAETDSECHKAGGEGCVCAGLHTRLSGSSAGVLACIQSACKLSNTHTYSHKTHFIIFYWCIDISATIFKFISILSWVFLFGWCFRSGTFILPALKMPVSERMDLPFSIFISLLSSLSLTVLFNKLLQCLYHLYSVFFISGNFRKIL